MLPNDFKSPAPFCIPKNFPIEVLAAAPSAPSTPEALAAPGINVVNDVNNLLCILANGAITANLPPTTLIKPATIAPSICCFATSCGSSCLTIKSGYIVVVKPVDAFIE